MPLAVRIKVLSQLHWARTLMNVTRNTTRARMNPTIDDNTSRVANQAIVPQNPCGASASSPLASRSAKTLSVSGARIIRIISARQATVATNETVIGKIRSVCMVIAAALK